MFSANGRPLTRFGIYKVVRRHASDLDDGRTGRSVSPHIFRHTAAVHLLEAGVEVNVIRGWLGHADLTTTNRYAEINTRAKIEALRATEPPNSSAGLPSRPVWRTDESLLNWLSSSDPLCGRNRRRLPVHRPATVAATLTGGPGLNARPAGQLLLYPGLKLTVCPGGANEGYRAV